VSRARNRPPRLVSHAGESRPAPAPTLEALIERSKIAGTGSGPGPTELRRNVERLAAGDRSALGELAPVVGLTPADVWLAIKDVFGATSDIVAIDAARTIAATRHAAARVQEVAASGARIAVATARPASLMMLHLAFARLARDCGGEVLELPDFGPIRADGRAPRWLRWVGGVAVVSDGDALWATRDGEAAREWVFAIPRPSLVIADGPFVEVAWETGIEVVALAGLDRPGLAVAAVRGNRCTFVPLRTDRPANAYGALEGLIAGAEPGPEALLPPPPDGPTDPPADAPSDPPSDPPTDPDV
jgi:Phosphatase